MKRVLHITYEYPPKGGIGVRRRISLARYLPSSGWAVRVVTVEDPPTSMLEPELLQQIPANTEVRRAWSPEPTRLIQLVRRLRGAFARPGEVAPSSPQTTPSYTGLPMWAIRLARWPFVPDEKRFWLGRAVRAALPGIDEVDVILTSGPPFTAHLVGERLSRITGAPLVCDFEDPWVGNSFFRPPTPLHAWLSARLERRVVERATAVIGVTEEMTKELCTRYPHASARFLTVENGFDESDFEGIAPRRPPGAAGRCLIVHAGTLVPPRTPVSFLRGISEAVQDSAVRETIFVTFIGAGDEWAHVAESLGISDIVTFEPRVPYRQSLEAVAGADVGLLILSSGAEAQVSLSGKLFEYIGLRKPVLAVVGAGAAADFVARNEMGVVADYGNPAEIAGAVEKVAAGWRSRSLPSVSDDLAARFTWKAAVERIAAVLNEVVRDDA